MWMTEDQLLYLHQTRQDSASKSLSLAPLQACSEVYYVEKQINYPVFLNHEVKCFCHPLFIEKTTEASQ